MNRTVIILVMGLAVAGCRASRGPLRLDHPDPANRIMAIKQAAAAQDPAAIPQLIESLDHDDPAVRFYAIGALHKLTGQTLDYAYYADDLERAPMVERWRN